MWMYSTKDMRPRYTSFHTKSWMDRAVGVTTVIRLKIIQDMQSGRTEEKYMEVAQGHSRMWFSLSRGITASLWYKAKWAAPPHYRGGKQNPNLKENKTMLNDFSSSHFNRLVADCPTAPPSNATQTSVVIGNGKGGIHFLSTCNQAEQREKGEIAKSLFHQV